MTTYNPGCLAAITRFFGLGQKTPGSPDTRTEQVGNDSKKKRRKADIKTPRQAICKTFQGHPGSCPQCGGELEQDYQSYVIATRTGKRLDDSFVTGGDYGWFCRSCPVVVLDTTELDQTLSFILPGWKKGREYTVTGIVDLNAIPASKRHLPIGASGNPIPLIKFRAPENAPPPAPQQKKRKR